MSHTFTQAYFHIVWGTKNRVQSIFDPERERIEKYMTGIIKNLHHKPLQLYCMSDHCHIVIAQNLNYTIPDLMCELKSDTTTFIKDNKLVKGKFNWQDGYAAFSVSKSRLAQVCNYVKNQPKHHRKKTFKEEYDGFVKEMEALGYV